MCSARSDRSRSASARFSCRRKPAAGSSSTKQDRIGRQRAGDLEQALVPKRQVAGELERLIAESDPREHREGLLLRAQLLGRDRAAARRQETGFGSRVGAQQHIVEQRHARDGSCTCWNVRAIPARAM